MDKQELGAFLRSRRERLHPQDAGLPSGILTLLAPIQQLRAVEGGSWSWA